MQKLKIDATKDTLKIDFDPSQNILEFSGVSYPSNPKTFFEPLIDWVEEYLLFAGKETITLHFRINYFNTSSSTYLFKILELLVPVYQKSKNVMIFWYYDDDEDSLDSWKSLMFDIDLPFEIVKET
jgi:hypothetical protein